MTQVTNNHATALALPSGQVLEPGQATTVTDWDAQKKNAVVQAWLKAEVLSDGSKPAKGSSGGNDDERDALAAELKRLGADFDPRTGSAKLRQLQATIVEKAQAGMSDEVWDALPAEERESRLQAAAKA